MYRTQMQSPVVLQSFTRGAGSFYTNSRTYAHFQVLQKAWFIVSLRTCSYDASSYDKPNSIRTTLRYTIFHYIRGAVN